jgi:hypothetical protein
MKCQFCQHAAHAISACVTCDCDPFAGRPGRQRKRFNHAYTIAFSLENGNEDGTATNEELFAALQRRLDDLRRSGDEIQEATGMPFDTYEVEDENGNEVNI